MRLLIATQTIEDVCAPLLPVTGDPVGPWDRWLALLENYLLALVHTGLAEALVSLSQAEGIVNLRPAHFLG